MGEYYWYDGDSTHSWKAGTPNRLMAITTGHPSKDRNARDGIGAEDAFDERWQWTPEITPPR